MSAIEALREAAGDAIICDGGENGYPTLHGQTTLVIDPARAGEVFDAALEAGFEHLAQLTAVDWLEGLPAPESDDEDTEPEAAEGGEPRFQITYNLYSYSAQERLSLIAFVPRDDPRIPTSANTWKAANWHERECFDMFGVVFEGHPDLTRIFMPDEWEGHPHRKDYDVTKEQYIYREGIEDRVTTDPSKGW